MKRKESSLALMFIFSIAYGQIGINNSSPKVTLDISPNKNDGSTAEGILMPQLAGDTLYNADIKATYKQEHDGVMIFVTEPPVITKRIGQTVDIDSRGYYYYDSFANKWIKMFFNQNGGAVNALSCSGITATGDFAEGLTTSGASFSIPYTGGNGGNYYNQAVTSSGVTGLTATLLSGSLNNGNGNLVFTVTGKPNSLGTAQFAITFGGQSCTFNLPVRPLCGAYIAPGVWKEFMCHNLGANKTLDPFVSSKEIQGSKYQWGRALPAISQEQDQLYPTTPVNWNNNPASDNSWKDASKTYTDPCPQGYRVPTQAQWQGLSENNQVSLVGTWNLFASFESGIKFGDFLFLPAAGYRTETGLHFGPGVEGVYWSSTQISNKAIGIVIYNTIIKSMPRLQANSVRCVKE